MIAKRNASRATAVLAPRATWLLALALPLIPCCSFSASFTAQAQGNEPEKPPLSRTSVSPQNPAPAQTPAPAAEADANQPLWDPLRAEKSIEVGQYYLKRGNYDAAIERFRDAALYHPGRALPYKLLGLAQEKKGLKTEAAQSFQKYLDLYPHAEDADKIRKHIAKLWQELGHSKKKSRSGERNGSNEFRSDATPRDFLPIDAYKVRNLARD